ncbi:unnamed protein product [Camellia sinensis]
MTFISATRKVCYALTALNYNQGALSVNTYGSYWRVLRRLYSKEILLNRRIEETVVLRRKCVDNMIEWIEEDVERQGRISRINRGMVHDMGRTMKIVERFVKERNRERELGK